MRDDNALFNEIVENFRDKITTWDYFVNWEKVFSNVKPIEKELNLLNYLIGKDNIEYELCQIIKQYPSVIKSFPFLIACREKSFDVLIDTKKLISKRYDFSTTNLSDVHIKDLADFVVKSGFADILQNRQIKNLVDYAVGVEVGLDSNGRKNRGGKMMENIVEVIVDDLCVKSGAEYISQATADRILKKWNVAVEMDKSSRIIDFAVYQSGKLYLIEVNFYSGGGSKLKSTATEYIEMYDRWHKQGFEFIWVTDGAGWKSTLKPLREYFDKSDYLLNLEMLQNGIFEEVIK